MDHTPFLSYHPFSTDQFEAITWTRSSPVARVGIVVAARSTGGLGCTPPLSRTLVDAHRLQCKPHLRACWWALDATWDEGHGEVRTTRQQHTSENLCPPCMRSLKPFHSQVQKYILPTLKREMYICEVVRIGKLIISHLSELRKAKFFILCDVIFLVRLQEKFEIDHSWEWKG